LTGTIGIPGKRWQQRSATMHVHKCTFQHPRVALHPSCNILKFLAEKSWLSVKILLPYPDLTSHRESITLFCMSGTSSAAIEAARVTTGALKAPFERWAGLRTWVPNTPALWPTGEAISADCILPLFFAPCLLTDSHFAAALAQSQAPREPHPQPHSCR
jgi:hypothetical protein